MYGLSRGVQNNNPLNIRLSSDQFQGEIIPSMDASFKQFTSAVFGIRAGAVILGNYYKVHHLTTVRQITARWAPDSENDTAAYKDDVCKHMGAEPDEQLDLLEPETMVALEKAMMHHENGYDPYSDDEIMDGVKLALRPVVS